MKMYLPGFLILISCGTESETTHIVDDRPVKDYKLQDSSTVENLLDYKIIAPNLVDETSLKQGNWCIYGKDEPARGYPDEGKIEEGAYTDDKKVGDWIYYSREGAVDSIISYRSDIPKHSTSAINKVDANGVKNGYWIFYGKDLSEQNYPRESKVEEGRFKDGIKDGRWFYFGKDGNVDSSVTYVGDSISSVYNYREKKK